MTLSTVCNIKYSKSMRVNKMLLSAEKDVTRILRLKAQECANVWNSLNCSWVRFLILLLENVCDIVVDLVIIIQKAELEFIIITHLV